jgi:hypothetical protein
MSKTRSDQFLKTLNEMGTYFSGKTISCGEPSLRERTEAICLLEEIYDRGLVNDLNKEAAVVLAENVYNRSLALTGDRDTDREQLQTRARAALVACLILTDDALNEVPGKVPTEQRLRIFTDTLDRLAAALPASDLPRLEELAGRPKLGKFKKNIEGAIGSLKESLNKPHVPTPIGRALGHLQKMMNSRRKVAGSPATPPIPAPL